ncbi:MAG: hypothetical protein NT178_09695 [Proteobacteria bacterium]|nr:hypothetical protein [Pseudomonadota bacterium]
MYTKSDLQTLIEKLRVFLASVEHQIKTTPEVVPEKKPVKILAGFITHKKHTTSGT